MKICPDCQRRYDDDVSVCADDGEELVDLPDELSGNPKLQEPVPASPADRTSMIDLEAIEAKRAQKKAERAAADGDEGGEADDKTPPPEEPLEDDVEATGTMQRTRGRRRKQPTLVAEEEPLAEEGAEEGGEDGAGNDDIPADRRVSDEETNRDMTSRSRMSRASRMSRTGQGTAVGTRPGTRTNMTRATQMAQAKPKKRISATQASVLVLIGVSALVAGIVVVARSTAVLTVTTVPPGATVTLDGVVLGTSPVQKRVRTGDHAVELSLVGYEPYKEVVAVPPAGLPFLQPLQKKPPPPPPPPSPAQIAADMAKAAAQLFDGGDLDGANKKLDEALSLAASCEPCLALKPKVDDAIAKRTAQQEKSEAKEAREERLRKARVLAEEGKQLYRQNRLGPAKDKLYQSLKLDPENPEPHRTLARIFNREDDVDKVRYHLQRYLDLGGGDSDFKVREWLKNHPR